MAHEPDLFNLSDTEQFVAVCHDLRQYISAGLLLSHMPGDDVLDENERRRLEMIHEQFRGASDLVATAVGDTNPQLWKIDLAHLVSTCVDLVRLVHDVSVETDLPERAETCGDAVLLKRAVSNLLENACRAVEPDGKVMVRVSDHGNEIWIEVADNGLGFGLIASGTGHGLPIVNAALRASAGRLQISSGPGPGTTVLLALPSLRDTAI